MPAPDAIACDRLAKLIGTPKCPVILDVRRDAVRAADPRLIPGARSLPETALSPDVLPGLASTLQGAGVVVVCAEGHRLSQGVATRFGAMPYDIEGVFWSHRDALCTFDILLSEFGLSTPALDRLALIVRGADTGRLDRVPEAAGLMAASLGLSRMYSDDLEQLEAGIALYDAFYRWARDATGETHNWPAAQKG